MANDIRVTKEENVKRVVVAMRDRYKLWKEDEEFGREGWTSYYAVDTDVIWMYLDPTTGYRAALTFPSDNGDEQTGAKILGSVLGEFLFASKPDVNNGLPPHTYLVISPHDEEISRMLGTISRRMFVSGVDIDRGLHETFPKLQAILIQFAEALSLARRSGSSRPEREEKARVQLAEQLQSQAADLLKLSNSRSRHVSALGKFADLRNGIFQNLHNIQIGSSAQYLSDFLPLGWQQKVQELVPDIYGRLLSARKKLKPFKDGLTIETDAVVLSTLEVLNEALSIKKIRVLLVTGSAYLYEALSEYRPVRNNMELRAYSDIYLRHPQWMMAHPSFFGTDKYSGMNFGSWMEILFPNKHGRDLSEVNRVIGNEELMAVQSRWNSFLEVLSAEKSIVSMLKQDATYDKTAIARDMIDDFVRLMEEGDLTVDSLKPIFKRPAVETVSQLYLSSSWLGLLDSPVAFSGETKCIPALAFDPPYEGCEVYYQSVRSLLSRNGDHSPYALDELKRVNDRINLLDPSLYHSHLIHAAAYAAKGHWHPAIALCNMALEVSDSLDQTDRSERRKGREAAYLAAVATRRSAERGTQLGKARTYIQLAVDRRADHEPEDLRFEGERISIEVRDIYFLEFVENKVVEAGRTESLLAGLLVLISKTKAMETAHEYDKTYPVKRVYDWVMRQAYSNLGNLLLIDLWKGGSKILEERYSNISRDMGQIVKEEDRKLDPMSWTILAVMRAVSSQVSAAPITDEGGWIWDAPSQPRHPYIRGLFQMYQELIAKPRQ